MLSAVANFLAIMSIRSRLICLVLCVLLPALGVAAWTVFSTLRSEREAMERNLRDTTRALSMVVDRELAKRATVAQMLSLSIALDSAPDVAPADLRRFEEQVRRALMGLQGTVVLYSESAELLNTRAPGLAQVSAAAAAVSSAALPLRDRAAILPLSQAMTAGDLQAAVVQPVFRDGRTVLNLAVTVLPSELQPIVDRHGVPAQWIAAVLDSEGRLVARSRAAAEFVGRPPTPDLQRALAAQKEGVHESVTLDGTEVLLYFSTSDSGWTYVTGVPRSMLVGGWRSAASGVAIGAFSLLGLATLGAIGVSRRIAGPIYDLESAAGQLGQGKPVAPFATGMPECDRVASALSDAAQRHQRARADLEQQVSMAVARTREAEQRASDGQRIEALGRLTGGVAHDFNNLLGVVSNSAYVIQRRAGEGPVHNAAMAILRAVELGSRLTRHLLSFAGRQPVSPKTIDVAPMLREVQELIKAVIGSGIRLSVEVAAETARITVDSSELELALINLALNARDAMPGGGELRLRARDALPDECTSLPRGAYVVIEVSDTGVGVAGEQLQRMFEPFYTTKGVGKGTGLGLSQVHGFCKQAGGTALARSVLGQGTTISLVLPSSQGLAELEQPQPQTEVDAGLAGLRVLLVEDNEAVSETTLTLLDSFGCHVGRAGNAAAALQAIGDDPAFDVVLSDVVMPGSIDGVGLARALRQRFPTLPVVLITGFARSLDDAGDVEVLRKPCTAQALAEALRRARTRVAA